MAQPPQNMSREQFANAVHHVIRERKTAKVLRAPDTCFEGGANLPPDFAAALRRCIESAGWAPFHKMIHKETHLRGKMISLVPWRFYVLKKSVCCAVVDQVRARAELQPDSKWSRAWTSKIPRLLSGAGACVMVTWLPDPAENGGEPVLNENNIEHIAAASAAAQNLLLACESQGMYTYWATGGILRDDDVFDWLRIPRTQKLLGAIFVSPAESVGEGVTIEAGSLRDQRGAVEDWSVWIDSLA